MEVRDAIMMTASMADSANNTYGYGILNAGSAINYGVVAGSDKSDNQPDEYNLIRAYPNPFNPTVNILVDIGRSSEVKVDILSYDGTLVTNIYDSWTIGEVQQLQWKPKNISSGIYFIRAAFNGNHFLRKITYIK